VAGPAGPGGPQGPAGPIRSWTKFRDFLFDFDKSDLRSNETSKVSEIAAYLQQHPIVSVAIDGYTDPRGTNAYNQALSERRVDMIRGSLATAGVLSVRRVQAIRQALIAAGVAPDRISAGTFGARAPLCGDSTVACLALNRRVEVLAARP
jgi:OmpA-OmpF porin, OOP family